MWKFPDNSQSFLNLGSLHVEEAESACQLQNGKNLRFVTQPKKSEIAFENDNESEAAELAAPDNSEKIKGETNSTAIGFSKSCKPITGKPVNRHANNISVRAAVSSAASSTIIDSATACTAESCRAFAASASNSTSESMLVARNYLSCNAVDESVANSNPNSPELPTAPPPATCIEYNPEETVSIIDDNEHDTDNRMLESQASSSMSLNASIYLTNTADTSPAARKNEFGYNRRDQSNNPSSFPAASSSMSNVFSTPAAAHHPTTTVIPISPSPPSPPSAKRVFSEEDMMSLLLATAESDICVVEQLLLRGINPDETADPQHHTALHVAARRGHIKIVELLLKHHASPHCKTKERMLTPLHLAAGNNHLDCMLSLLENNACIDALGRDKETPLWCSAASGKIEACKMLLEMGCKLNPANDERWDTPLHAAAVMGQQTIVQLLLNAGARANVYDDNDLMPIHYAAFEGHVDVLQILLQADKLHRKNAHDGKNDFTGTQKHKREMEVSSPRICESPMKQEKKVTIPFRTEKNDCGETNGSKLYQPFCSCAHKRIVMPISYSGQKGGKKSSSCGDTNGLNTEQVATPLNEVKLNAAKDKDNGKITSHFQKLEEKHPSVLCCAITATRNEAVVVLLKNGADPNAMDPRLRMSPLHAAAITGESEICKLLLDAGASPEHKTECGNTAHDLAEKEEVRNLLHKYLRKRAIKSALLVRKRCPNNILAKLTIDEFWLCCQFL